MLWAPYSLVGWTPLSLVGLPCAVLLIISPLSGSGFNGIWSQSLAGMIGAVSVTILFVNADTRLGAALSAYVVLATAAFVSLVLLRPDTILRQALRSMGLAMLACAVLIEGLWGSSAWGGLAWGATRAASEAMRFTVGLWPATYPMYEPMVRILSLTWPATLALQTLAGLALAWQLYRRVTKSAGGEPAATPTPPLMRFKDFAIGDGWVWGIVAWLGVLILPVSSALHVAGTNVGLVAGTLYVLRGAAIVAAFAEAFGISALTLVLVAAAAAALALPLVFVLPGLCTLGITDTWYQYRRRLADAKARQGQRPNTP